MRRSNLGERPKSRGDLLRWYAEALDKQSSSGLSIAEYAEGLGVTAATLYQWRRRLSAERDDDRLARGRFGLVEVAVERKEAQEDGGTFVVRLDHDRGLEVPRKFADAELRRLITLLESC